MNIPNAISMARLISGPFVTYFILQEQWAAALGLLGVAGASDWADGYAAKHYGQSSVLGSYLDPLADKVLVCCTVGALAQQVISLVHIARQQSSIAACTKKGMHASSSCALLHAWSWDFLSDFFAGLSASGTGGHHHWQGHAAGDWGICG